MAVTDCGPDCHCRACGLAVAAGAAAARHADDPADAHGDGHGDGDAAAVGAADTLPADGDGCPRYDDGDYSAAYDYAHATADLDADGHGRGFTWYRTRTGRRYVMEYRLPIL